MTFKKLINQIHLWLGLTSGLGVIIISITGCIYAFQAEIQEMTQPYRNVVPQSKEMLVPSELKEIAENQLPGKKVHSVEYSQVNRASVVTFYSIEPEYYYLVYLNPYNGKVLKVKDMSWDFFSIILDGHFYLWLPHEIGQPVVASITLVFLVMVFSGLVLWWPKNKSAAKQRFSIKWTARWRRRNYDLHNVLGFYMTWVIIFIAITGLVWGFQWFSRGAYWTISGGKEFVDYSEPLSDTTSIASNTELQPADKLWNKLKQEINPTSVVEVHFPETTNSSILMAINPNPGTYYKMDYRFFDQYSLKELKVDHMWQEYKNLALADRIYRMNYDIHVGAILGLPGKFLAFFASLIAASLPFTGFYIWWGRKKKSKEKPTENKIRQPNTVKRAIVTQ